MGFGCLTKGKICPVFAVGIPRLWMRESRGKSLRRGTDVVAQQLTGFEPDNRVGYLSFNTTIIFSNTSFNQVFQLAENILQLLLSNFMNYHYICDHTHKFIQRMWFWWVANGDMSGERGGQSIGPRLLIHFSGKTSFKKHHTFEALCQRAQCCW